MHDFIDYLTEKHSIIAYSCTYFTLKCDDIFAFVEFSSKKDVNYLQHLSDSKCLIWKEQKLKMIFIECEEKQRKCKRMTSEALYI